MNIVDIIPLLVGLLGFITAIVALRKGMVKEKADAAQSIATAAATLIEKYESRLDDLEKTVKEQAVMIESQDCEIAKQAIKIRRLEAGRTRFLKGVQLLCDQIKGLGHKPVWEPEKEA